MMSLDDKKALIAYRIENSMQTLEEIPTHISNGYLKTAINRMYYACFYMVTALLIKNNISVYTHAGVRQMLGLHFVKEGKLEIKMSKFYNDLFVNRQEGDYSDFVYYDSETVSEMFDQAIQFVKAIQKLIED
jgi:uncharacterized protein (UPF0332 family)